MNGFDREPLRRLLLRLPVALLVAMALWLVLRPALDVVTAKAAQTLIRAYEYPRVTRLEVVDHRAEVQRSDFRAGSKIPTVALTEVHFNTIVLLALFLALPRPWSGKQLERLFMAWSLLLATQSLNLVFHVKTLYALGLGEWSLANYSDLARNIYGLGRYFTDLPGRFAFPFLLWLFFNWQTLLGGGAGKRPKPQPERRRRAR